MHKEKKERSLVLIKRKRVFLIIGALIMALALIVAGCGGTQPAPQAGEEEAKEWPKSLTIGSASIGGTYYLYAGGWSQVIEKATGIPTGVEVTGGPNHNMQLVHNGELELGMVTMGPAWEGWHGEGDWTGGVKMTNVRAIFPMYNTYSQWWAFKNAGIESIYDLEGKRVGVGPAGGTAGTYHPRILELLGINATVRHAGISDLVAQHQDGQLDANSFAAGIPVAAVMEAAAQKELVLFGIDGEARDKVCQEWPFWSPAVIPADTYDFLTEDVETIGIWNMAICSKDLPDDLVYEIVKAVFENHDTMVTAHQAAAETVPENVVLNTWLPLHPGAIKYYEELGIELPPDVYPPEYQG
jgi:hypothetical protein